MSMIQTVLGHSEVTHHWLVHPHILHAAHAFDISLASVIIFRSKTTYIPFTFSAYLTFIFINLAHQQAGLIRLLSIL